MHIVTRRAVVAGIGGAVACGLGGPSGALAGSAEGVRMGDQFPDIVYHTAEGDKKNVSAARGTVSLAYFWASWCPICAVDIYNIRHVYEKFKDNPKFTPIILNFLDPYKSGLAWAEKKNVKLPFADSGISGKSPVATTMTGTYSMPLYTPLFYILDAKGAVALHAESKRNDSDEAEGMIQKLLTAAS